MDKTEDLSNDFADLSFASEPSIYSPPPSEDEPRDEDDEPLPRPGAASFLDECSFLLPNLEPTVVRAFVLSKWDHILGPRAVHVWMLDNSEAVQDEDVGAREDFTKVSLKGSALLEAIHYVVDHSLNASDAGGDSACARTPKNALFIVPRDYLVSYAICFQVNTVAYSLSAVFDEVWLEFVCKLQTLMRECLEIQTAKLKIFLTNENQAAELKRFTPYLVDFCELLSALNSSKLTKCELGGSVMNLMADKRFFEKCLTSFLQTGGKCLVVGASEKAVGAMVGILALFLDEEEKLGSACGFRKFFPGIHLQGYLVDPAGMSYISAASLLESPSPLTVIDMNKGQVKQTALKHQHSKMHLLALKQNLLALKDSQTKGSPVSEMILHPVKEGSHLVIGLVKEILKVPPELWEYVVGLFMRELTWRAYALIQVVEDETNWISQDIDVGSAKQPMHKYLQSLITGGSCSTPEEADFLIILAMADKISPGIYNYVMNKKIPV